MSVPPVYDHPQEPPSPLSRGTLNMSAVFLFLVLLIMPIVIESGRFNTLGLIFVGIILEAVPFMLVGALVGGMIESFVSRDLLVRLLPRRRWMSVFAAAGLGIVLPVCECAVVPVVRRLMGKGLPLSAAIAYLLGGPIVNPIVAASTALAYAFDGRMVLLRLGMGYGIAVLLGLAIGWLFKASSAQNYSKFNNDGGLHCCDACRHAGFKIVEKSGSEKGVETVDAEGGCSCVNHLSACHSKETNWRDKLISALRHGGEDFFAVGHYLVMGAFIAALAQTYIDRSAFVTMMEIPVISIGLMMALAVLLNLCSEADAFIAASFRGLMPVSAQLAFMLTGPMFDLKLLLMYQSLFRKRMIAVLATLILLVVFAVCVAFEILVMGWI